MVHTEAPTATELDTKAVRCSCPDSPWCTGPTGPYWLTCSRACRSCNPPKRRPSRPRPIEDGDPSSGDD